MKIKVRLREGHKIPPESEDFDIAYIIGFVRGENDVPQAAILTENGNVILCNTYSLKADMKDFLLDRKNE